MTCEEFRELAGAYALRALDAEEHAACEAHLAEPQHRGCEEALRRAYSTVGALASGLPPVAPGEGVWRAIEARMESSSSPAEPRRRRSAWAGWAGAAAAALFLVLWIRGAREAEQARAVVRSAELQAQAEAKARSAAESELRSLRAASEAQRQVAVLLDTPGSRVVSLEATPGRTGRATAVVNLAARRAVIVSASLPPEGGKAYQLWVIAGNAPPAPAGFLTAADGVLLGQIDPALLAAAPDALAVSLEPPGGSAAPTDVRLVGKLSPAG